MKLNLFLKRTSKRQTISFFFFDKKIIDHEHFARAWFHQDLYYVPWLSYTNMFNSLPTTTGYVTVVWKYLEQNSSGENPTKGGWLAWIWKYMGVPLYRVIIFFGDVPKHRAWFCAGRPPNMGLYFENGELHKENTKK